MYFEITKTSKSVLNHSIDLGNDQWLHTCWPLTNYTSVGYQLGEYGGNFVNISVGSNNLVLVKFSFYKDFYLTHDPDNGIILSNIAVHHKKIPNTVVSAELFNSKLKLIHFEVTKFFNIQQLLTFDQAVDRLEQHLAANIVQCAQKTNQTKIVYTGGLDSSTNAFVAKKYGVDFVAVVNQNHKKYWHNLPFDQVQYSHVQLCPEQPPTQGLTDNIKSSFYQKDFDQLITGFFGDLVMVHNHTWFQQCSQWSTNHYRYPVYDKTVLQHAVPFSNKIQAKAAVLKNHSIPWFRHWFDDFEILDPYRDPEILKTTMSLSFEDLVEQAGTARIQKQLIDKLGVDRHSFVCDYKNDYSKF